MSEHMDTDRIILPWYRNPLVPMKSFNYIVYRM